ncbi:hypothetical protein QFC21_006612 [Naganishia friedmannii]|uniref:Uncharacterized protein n=1 Tax=Naganishia friedmannii TaxID=89922 RepID=A0ACC2V1A5_9TREE|nr:hypothetical protein QFC21_006612 [Naganishia friedmannii]
MSDLPRYELVPSHDASDSKSHRGPAHGDEEQGFFLSAAEVGTSSSSGAAPSRICYSFKPEYPVPGKEEDVVGIRGTSKQHTIAIVKRAFQTLEAYPDERIEFLLPSTDSETVTKDTKWFRMLDEAWAGLDAHPPSVMRVQVKVDARDLLKQKRRQRRIILFALSPLFLYLLIIAGFIMFASFD